MKTTILTVFLAFIASCSFAYQSVSSAVYSSSFTLSNDTMVYIPGTLPGTQLFSVVVAKLSFGTITIYDGQGANATNKIATISLLTGQSPQFNVVVSSGITYTTTVNAGGVTINYLNPNVP